jgi:Glycine zipper 2TM domain
MNLIRMTTVAALLASFVSFQPAIVTAQGRDRRDRQEDKWERKEAHREHKEARREWRDEGRRDRYESRRDRYEARRDYWDAARYYRGGNRYRAQRMNRGDRIYRGSDNRYYCRRDDGTTGLIVGGVAGAVLGNVIAPGGSKILGTIIGGGAGALLGRAVDDGDMVCR